MTQASDFERQMLALINQERTSRGLDPLQLELRLNESAERHSEWMLATDTFSHTGAGGSSSNTRMRQADFDFSGSWSSGENIAVQSERGASGISDDVVDLHEALMNSPGHRANILKSGYDYVGIGIERGNYNGWDAVIVTQNFASTSGQVRIDGGSGGSGTQTPPEDLTPQVISGTGSGEDLRGTMSDDVMRGEGGADRLFGRAGDDRLEGGSGNDRLTGGSGQDTLSGGSGNDCVDYKSADGVRVDLKYAQNNTGDARGDSFISIEWLGGSRKDDDLRGNDGDNRIWGARGDDEIQGRGGDDKLVGGGGNDTLIGQDGEDRLKGGGGADTFVFHENGDRDVVLDFRNNVDVLDFRDFDANSVGALMNDATERNGDVVFDFGGGDRVVIQDATIAQVQDDILI
ncbi:CAP domain-containing protein [Jannaschia sp. S6380]|uniref:CAP domain-containing protein n=1 Tax=Jannaschia sp. S6380 TaxID=2926408 RepID=UPI001FF3490A|nr:CAP domain-containing protein [Jannaschia sp. S6380]MCK0168407.1 CAP domain-containing protein [Jannaschia sp. S6380]